VPQVVAVGLEQVEEGEQQLGGRGRQQGGDRGGQVAVQRVAAGPRRRPGAAPDPLQRRRQVAGAADDGVAAGVEEPFHQGGSDRSSQQCGGGRGAVGGLRGQVQVDAAHQLTVDGAVLGQQRFEVTVRRLPISRQERADDQGHVRPHVEGGGLRAGAGPGRGRADVAGQEPAVDAVAGQRARPGRVELGVQHEPVGHRPGARRHRTRRRALDEPELQRAGEATGRRQPHHDRVRRPGGEDLDPAFRSAELHHAGGEVDGALELPAGPVRAHGQRRGADQGIDPDRFRVRRFAGHRLLAHLLGGPCVVAPVQQLPQPGQDRGRVGGRQRWAQRQEQPLVRDGEPELGRRSPAQRALPAVAGHQRVLPIDSVPHRP
jgi:hypothetical protein